MDLASCNSAYRLRYWNLSRKQCKNRLCCKLQQRLPLAVLKRSSYGHHCEDQLVATALTACGIETVRSHGFCGLISSCNSAYRLRYWNNLMKTILFHIIKLQQRLPLAVLKQFTTSDSGMTNSYSCNSAYRLRYATKGDRKGRKCWWGLYISSSWPEGKQGW